MAASRVVRVAGNLPSLPESLENRFFRLWSGRVDPACHVQSHCYFTTSMFALTYLTHLNRLVGGALRVGLVVALPALAVACGAQTANAAPILDSVDAPLVVTAQNGSYTIPVSLLFHDNDGEAVTRLHYRLAPNIDSIVDVPSANPSRESAEVTIVIAASALDSETPDDVTVHGESQDAAKRAQDGEHGRDQDAHRARTLQISVVDGRGAESIPQISSVTLN